MLLFAAALCKNMVPASAELRKRDRRQSLPAILPFATTVCQELTAAIASLVRGSASSTVAVAEEGLSVPASLCAASESRHTTGQCAECQGHAVDSFARVPGIAYQP